MSSAKLIIWLCSLSVLLFVNSCGRQTRLLELVPASSNMVVIINWAEVRNDDGLKRISRAEIYEEQIKRFGIDSQKVSELIVFGIMGGSTQGGLLLRGSFDERKAIASLKSQGWSETTVEGHKVYVKGADYVASPAESVLVAGTLEGVTKTFQAAKDNRKSLSTSASFKKIKTSLSGSKSPITAVLLAPDGTIEAVDAALTVTGEVLSLFDMGQIGTILKMLNIASGAGFTMAHGTNQKYAVNMSVLMRDEKTAKIAVGSLNILKSMSEAVSNNSKDRETAEALQDFDFSREENVLLLKMQMPEKALLPNNQ